MQHWDTLLPEALQRWQLQPNVLGAFSDGYRNASLMKGQGESLRAAASRYESTFPLLSMTVY